MDVKGLIERLRSGTLSQKVKYEAADALESLQAELAEERKTADEFENALAEERRSLESLQELTELTIERWKAKFEAAREVAVEWRRESRWGGQPLREIDAEIEAKMKKNNP